MVVHNKIALLIKDSGKKLDLVIFWYLITQTCKISYPLLPFPLFNPSLNIDLAYIITEHWEVIKSGD